MYNLHFKLITSPLLFSKISSCVSTANVKPPLDTGEVVAICHGVVRRGWKLEYFFHAGVGVASWWCFLTEAEGPCQELRQRRRLLLKSMLFLKRKPGPCQEPRHRPPLLRKSFLAVIGFLGGVADLDRLHLEGWAWAVIALIPPHD